MRNAITFLECRVQGEFHHDNLLRWVLLVEDMKERERVSDKTSTSSSSISLPLHASIHIRSLLFEAPTTSSNSLSLTSVFYLCLIYLHTFILFSFLGILFPFSFAHHFSSFPCCLLYLWLTN